MRSPTQSNSVITIEFRSAIPGSEKRMELFLEQVSRQAGTSVTHCKGRQESIFAFGKRFPSRQVQAFPNYLSSAAAGPPLSSV